MLIRDTSHNSQAESKFNDTERPCSRMPIEHSQAVAASLDRAPAILVAFLFRVNAQLQLSDWLLFSFSPVRIAEKDHKDTREAPDIPVEHHIRWRTAAHASFPRTEAAENDSSKPLFMRSTEAGILKMRCTYSKKIDTSWVASWFRSSEELRRMHKMRFHRKIGVLVMGEGEDNGEVNHFRSKGCSSGSLISSFLCAEEH